MDPAVPSGSSWGRYRVLDRIASGGMGSVHLARSHGELGFSRPVALKVLHAHLLQDQQLVDRFLAEARVASRIAHPNVVAVLDVGRHEGNVFLALDYVHGESLSALLRVARTNREWVPLDVLASIAVDFLEGLHAAHELVDEAGVPLGLVHRDVSPHNILVGARGVAYVTDFGVAKIRDGAPVTQSGALIGKAGYMAPEQLRGRSVTRATDLYGAGIVLWEAITSQRLFQGLEDQMQRTIERFVPDPPGLHRDDVPAALDALVLRMLQPDPSARPATAQDVARELADIVKPAHTAKVAEWVMGLAQGSLDRREAILRAAEQPVAPAAIPVDVVTTVVEERTALDETALTAGTFQDSAGFGPPVRRRAWRWAGAAAAVVLVSVAVGVQGLATKPTPVPNVAHVPEAPSAQPEPVVAVVPAPSVAAEPPPAASVRTPPAGRPRAAPVAADCTVPYVVVGNIKRWRRECFAKGQHAP